MNTKARDDLIEMYRVIGETYGAEEARILAATPGWNERLLELEESWTIAWKKGQDCETEFVRLREHWRNGIRLTKEVRKSPTFGLGNGASKGREEHAA